MQIKFNLELIHKRDLTPNEFVVLHQLFFNKSDFMLYVTNNSDYDYSLKKLIEADYLTEDLEFSKASKSYLKAFENESLDRDVDKWIDEYRKKFSFITGKMGTRKACIDKMNRFFKENPTFTKQDVLKATDKYTNYIQNSNSFMQQADYFIYKEIIDGGVKTLRSTLQSMIEEIKIDDNKVTENSEAKSFINLK